MRILSSLILILFAYSVQSQNNHTTAQKVDYDIVVIGGTPAGVTAAIGAARMEVLVLLVEQGPGTWEARFHPVLTELMIM